MPEPDPATWRGLLAADQFRHTGRSGVRDALHLLATEWSFRYLVVFRYGQHVRHRGRRSPRYLVVRTLHRTLAVRYGYEIPLATSIGPGLYLGHLGPIIVSEGAVLGANVNLSNGVVIGRSNRGETAGAPVIGDGVFVAPGAKIIGRLHVGDGAAIGANAVVLADVPAGVTVAGIPARVVSDEGAEGYVNRTVPVDPPASRA